MMTPPFARWEPHEITIERMDGQPPKGFDCGREPQNEFLYERAWRDQKAGISVTYLLFVSGMVAGFITLLTDKIRLSRDEKLPRVFWSEVPAVKLAQVAVDRKFSGQGLGKMLVAYGVGVVRQFREYVGCRLVTLDAQTELVNWYAAQTFQPNGQEQRDRIGRAQAAGRDADNLPVSMRFDLREARR